VSTSGGIRSRIADPGYTPGLKALPELLGLVAADDEAEAKLATRAVLKIEAQYLDRVAQAVISRAEKAERPARGRLTALVGRLDTDASTKWLMSALTDADPKTRRAAARALGNAKPTAAITAALQEALEKAPSDDDRKALGLALGKAGIETGQTGRAALIARRQATRKNAGAIEVEASLPKARVHFYVRSGLEEVLKDELSRATKFVSPGIIETTLNGPLSSALAIRTALDVGFPLEDRTSEGDLAAEIAEALTSEEALRIFGAFTTATPARFRLSFAKGGHQRSIVWKVAETIASSTKEIVNDPKESTWEARVDLAGKRLRITLFPRGFEDTRFAYRQDQVPASSHPTVAAALARLAPRHKDDVVWDPFAGAGAELVERARLGPYARLHGTDLEKEAVAAARANAKRAGVERIVIEKGDALDPLVPPDGVTVIITNPPMGRRVQRGTHADLLDRFVERAFEVLMPGGALVWLVPEPRRTRARAEAAGFVVERATSVDMGGFSAELSIYVKPRSREAAKPRSFAGIRGRRSRGNMEG
jgi:23S rRNA G2445 N2-methylase RlmL